MKSEDFEKHRTGTYTEPFTHQEVGLFVTSAEGDTHFLCTGVSERDAFLKGEEYYRHMSQFPQNNMDMTDLTRITYKVRDVTRSPWRDA